jgi:soluble lytic murein transglycosylase
MPATASILARRAGLGYSPGLLREADYNMRLGGYYLGQLVDEFGGSYPMASAAYNAGPGRPATWVGYCGDPRGGGTDPTDFIECIPFAETRNYVMRTMETMEVYRARLNGGTAPLTLAEDLKRGSWTPSPTPGLTNNLPSNAPTNGPIPYSQLSPAGAAR